MSKYENLQAEHQRLLQRKDAESSSPAFLQAVQDYIQYVKMEAAWVESPRDRSQLRANLRFWASYVFDNTGTYPDTTLLPAGSVGMAEEPVAAEAPVGAETPGEEAAGETVKGLDANVPPAKLPFYRRKIFWMFVAGTAAVLLLLYVFLQVLPLQTTQDPTQTPKPSLPPTATEYTETIPFTHTPTSDPPPKTPEPSMPPGEVEALLSTQIVLFNQALSAVETPMPTETPYSVTGGEMEGDYVWMQAVLTAGEHPNGCGARTLVLSIVPTDGLEKLANSTALVTVSNAGQGEQLYSGFLDFNGKQLDIRLPTQGAEMLLVQVDAAGFLFDTVILQFTPDCSRNLTSITYQTQADAGQISETLSGIQSVEVMLSLGWRLETWGPAALWDGWVASLFLTASGGDGSYIYWAEGNVAVQAGAPLPDARLVVTQAGCERAFLRVGVTSGGEHLTRPFSLLSPYCLEGSDSIRP